MGEPRLPQPALPYQQRLRDPRRRLAPLLIGVLGGEAEGVLELALRRVPAGVYLAGGLRELPRRRDPANRAEHPDLPDDRAGSAVDRLGEAIVERDLVGLGLVAAPGALLEIALEGDEALAGHVAVAVVSHLLLPGGSQRFRPPTRDGTLRSMCHTQ